MYQHHQWPVPLVVVLPSLTSTLAAGSLLLALLSAGLGVMLPALLGALSSVLFSVLWVYRGRWQASPMLLVAACFAVSILILPLNAIWLSIFFAAWLLSVALLWILPVPHLPPPSGTYGVGVKCVEFFDDSREADWADPPQKGRKIQAYIWYPADVAEGEAVSPYLTESEAAALSASLKVLGIPSFINRHLQLARTQSHRDAQITHGNYPLVIFNHGGALWPLQNTSLMQELASHGYVVCSLAHPGESAGIAWQDGTFTSIGRRLVATMKQHGDSLRVYAKFILSQNVEAKQSYLQALSEYREDYKVGLTQAWAQDSLSLVGALREHSEELGVGEIVQSTDLERRAYAGMSLGGSASHEACHQDPGALACINIDGMNWSFDRIGVHTPAAVLQIYGDPLMILKQLQQYADEGGSGPENVHPGLLMYNDFYYTEPAERDNREDLHRVIVRGAGHMAFTDKALNMNGGLRRLIGLGTLDGARAVRVLNELCLSFCDCYLAEDRTCRFGEAVAGLDEVVEMEPLQP